MNCLCLDKLLESQTLTQRVKAWSAPCKTCLLGRSYMRCGEASCMELMGCHLLEKLFPGASAFVASFLPFNMQTNCLPPRETPYARVGVCIQLSEKGLSGVWRPAWTFCCLLIMETWSQWDIYRVFIVMGIWSIVLCVRFNIMWPKYINNWVCGLLSRLQSHGTACDKFCIT